MIILGLTGRAGCGKDTVADILVRDHGYKRIAFADPLRAMAYDLNPIVDWHGRAPVRLQHVVDREGWDIAKRIYPEVRGILQRVGTDMVRNHVSPTFWVDRAMEILATAEPDSKWAVTDCRFANEAKAIEDVGWVIEISRPGVTPLPGNHASEAGVPGNLISFGLENDGTIEQLAEKVGWLAGYVEREHLEAS